MTAAVGLIAIGCTLCACGLLGLLHNYFWNRDKSELAGYDVAHYIKTGEKREYR